MSCGNILLIISNNYKSCGFLQSQWIPGQTLGVMTAASENCGDDNVEDCTT